MTLLRYAATSAAIFALGAAGQALAGPHGGPGLGHAAMPSAAAAPAAASNASATTAPTAGLRGPTHPTGQPGQTCGTPGALETPGHAASAPGSAFNPDGNAGTHYAGQQPQNSRNVASVAQYDAACSHQK
jgi:hypothetical protein